MPTHRYVEENGLAALLATKRLAGVTPEVNPRKHLTRMPLPSMNKTVHSGFEIQRRHHQRRHHQKFKTGVSVAPQKGLTSMSFN